MSSNTRVVYLIDAANCDRPLPSCLPGVQQTAIASQIRVVAHALACFASSWTHLLHSVSRSFPSPTFYSAWGCDHGGTRYSKTSLKPTISLDVISLVASSCGYYRGRIEHRAAHAFAVPVATQRGLAPRRQHRHPPRAQPVAPRRERHCRGPWLPPAVAPLRPPLAIWDTPVAHTGGDPTPSPHHAA